MLLAKVLDKLFNRRNTFEIESLEGDIVFNDISLKEVTDWVSEMKDLISYDGEYLAVSSYTKFISAVDFLDEVYLNLFNVYNIDSETTYFPDPTDNAGKVVVVNEDETGFEYVDAVDVKAPLYKLDFEATNLNGRTFTSRYTKALVSGGVLYVIISAVISNETGAEISAGNIQLRIRNIPTEVGSKIFCFNGALVSDESGGNPQICGMSIRRGNGLDSINNTYIFKGTKNGIDINVLIPTLSADTSIQVEGRTFIVLL